jgi:ActR/RegA family two-component response regulator
MRVENNSPFADVVRKELIRRLREHGGNVQATARSLGVPYRRFQRWLTELDVRSELRRVRGSAPRAGVRAA